MDIDDAIRTTLAEVPASSGDNLLGFQIDMQAYLGGEALHLAQISVEQTGDPMNALRALGTIEGNASTSIVADALERVWLEKLRYNHWERHDIEQTPDRLRMRFVTTSGQTRSDLCVTGEILLRQA
jgi:hypothetical protein